MEPTYKELVYEFYATFVFECDVVSFRLGGVDSVMDIAKFRVALGVWTQEELLTPLYQNTVKNFSCFELFTLYFFLHASG